MSRKPNIPLKIIDYFLNKNNIKIRFITKFSLFIRISLRVSLENLEFPITFLTIVAEPAVSRLLVPSNHLDKLLGSDASDHGIHGNVVNSIESREFPQKLHGILFDFMRFPQQIQELQLFLALFLRRFVEKSALLREKHHFS